MMRMKRIIFTKQKSIVTFQMADELSRQQTNSNKHEKRKGLTKRIASSSFSMSKNSRISKESGCCCAIKVCVYIFHNFYISIVFICYSFLFATLRFFLFAIRFYLLPFALSLRGFGQIAAQFTSIWTASISVEQLAILSIPSRNLGKGSGEF